MKKLPVGVQFFPILISDEYLYVDKTEQIFNLIHDARGHFLSRPRRFGKSLLVSTLASLFLGQRELFRGCWIDSADYHWTKYPVLVFDFSRLTATSPEQLTKSLNKRLEECAVQLNIAFPNDPEPTENLSAMVMQLYRREEVVILIDEYDHPLLQHIDNQELTQANQRILRRFFTEIKALGQYLRYAFVTGVSKFSKVSLFSGMNNLKDISLHSKHATLTGISEVELDTYYSHHIEKAAEKRQESIEEIRNTMRHWYNGYRFARLHTIEKVYNPVSIHLFLEQGELGNYWFSTATPSFASVQQ